MEKRKFENETRPYSARGWVLCTPIPKGRLPGLFACLQSGQTLNYSRGQSKTTRKNKLIDTLFLVSELMYTS
jgi:hypothetical protein